MDLTLTLPELRIDLGAVLRNYLALKKRLAKGADAAAVVKADAYGLGALPVARALSDGGCKAFFVATPEEGISLRSAVPEADVIYVLHGPKNIDIKEFFAHALTPVLCTPGDVALWAAEARKADRRLPAALHIDTGMNRLGLSAAEVERLTGHADLAALDLRLVMSHLACGDEPDHPMNGAQREQFEGLAARLAPRAARSLANSAGILLGSAYHYEMVRPGCALYGINPRGAGENPFAPVVTLTVPVLQLRDVETTGTVGYGGTAAVRPGQRLATLGLGYADGYARALTGRGAVWIDGRKCPLIGRVSMDSVVADVSGLETPPREGDPAEIIGPHQSADDVAAQAGTNGYEVLTSLGKRYKRVYA